ncbi:D-3-phosphoglycerate dehydrogenase/(S)-sulfolactate dehydrogenase [Microbacterium resistens]|uniref:D-3-phosphoglycerate dehydrogenase/(S)-sulfolactate dehydrogenase n=1 Tax=Microbacterium resistens TaxID=156977 RepID=A0ABU1SEX8_9MICO|nr:phosphoglycerate dehydrogenase [Microbacterium resistens]MDR6868149.1 D-3-phosphoglycerate dehydrogenase/(S)-sulfolactate dehydrogenase [Microbacterium resistens]
MSTTQTVDVLITTAFLAPGDEVDRILTGAGLSTRHEPGLDALSADDRRTLLQGVRAIIAGTRPLGGEDLDHAENLEVIVRTGVGYDSVDVDTATRHGIPVCITAGANRQAVAEHVFALLLASARRIPENIGNLADGRWEQLTGRELRGATLGILGLGSIGKAVARIGGAFDMDIVAYDPYFDEDFAAANGVRRADLEEVLAQSDFVTLHLFLDESTHNLLDAKRLSLMKSDAIVINTARGGIIDEQALVDAVVAGAIGGAALDVFAEEPLPSTSPLLHTPGILATTHVAGATREARGESGRIAATTVIDVLGGGDPRFVVNPDYQGVPA